MERGKRGGVREREGGREEGKMQRKDDDHDKKFRRTGMRIKAAFTLKAAAVHLATGMPT